MKIRLTLAQLKRILKTEKAKYPITIIMAGIDRAELQELLKLLREKKKD